VRACVRACVCVSSCVCVCVCECVHSYQAEGAEIKRCPGGRGSTCSTRPAQYTTHEKTPQTDTPALRLEVEIRRDIRECG